MFRFLLILSITLFSSPALAANDEVKPCTRIQLTQIANAIQESDFVDDYQSVVDDMKTISDDVDILYSLIEDMSALQSDWWGDIAASFPSCALGNEFSLVGGRMLDELLIAMSMARIAYTEILNDNEDIGANYLTRFQYHIGQWTDIQDDFINLINDVNPE